MANYSTVLATDAAKNTLGDQVANYPDIFARTLALLGVVAAAAVPAWMFLPSVGIPFVAWLSGIFLIIAVGFLAYRQLLANRPMGVAFAFAYAALEGAYLGWLSHGLADLFGMGLITQALVATVGTFAAAVAYSNTPWGRRTGKAVRVFTTALIGYLIFSLFNLVLAIFGMGDGWGLAGLGPLGIGLCLLGVILAAWSVNVDIIAIHEVEGTQTTNGVIWALSLSIVVDLVWMYVEYLRLLAVSRN